jgi:proline dehydrogenase
LELTEEEAKELQQELEGEDQQFRDPRVDQLIEQQQEMMLQQQATQLQAELETGINQHAAGKEVDLSERQLNSIFRDALDLAAQRNISPAQAADEAFREWFEEYESLSNRAIEQYRGSKKPRNQPPPKPGQSGVPEIPRGDNKAKLALANAIAEEAAQSS